MFKHILSYLMAGIMGGLIVLGGLQLLPTQDTTEEKEATAQLSSRQERMSVAAPFDFKAAAKMATPAVVHIEATQSVTNTRSEKRSDDPFEFFFGNPFDDYLGPKKGTGSGVIYTNDGYIITNNHVVDYADEITVTLYDNRKYQAELIGTYPEADLAVLYIEAEGLPTLDLANSDVADIGEWVLAVGNPFNLTSTVTAGIISAKGRSIDAIHSRQRGAIESFIQTDAAVNPGNSGGALVDAEGRLLGINTAIATRTGTFSGYSFAIPINLARRIADDIIENGGYERAMLGVEVMDMMSSNPEVQEAIRDLGIDESITQGVVVEQVVSGSAADEAGLRARDVIVAIDGKDIRSFPELQEAISSRRVGETVMMKVYRKNRYQDVAVQLRGMPSDER
ncbi:MAG: trypsin-like peptidase domain-containing protein [Bacteroidota bacterium]